MDALKPVEYFLNEEEKYIASKNGELEYFFDEEQGMLFVDDDLSFLNQNLFHKAYQVLESEKRKESDIIKKYNILDSELIMLMLYMGNMSMYFRDDFYLRYGNGIPALVIEMQKCLYSIIGKAPVFEGDTLYRFCVDEDCIDFAIGQKINFPYSLTTTTDNWNQDTNRYIIHTLSKEQTRAHCLYRVHAHGQENQVNFLPNTSFIVTDIQECVCGENVYKHIYMKEEM